MAENKNAIVKKVVDALWTSISENRGNTGAYLFDSIHVCLYLLYCKHKGYEPNPYAIADANPKDDVLKALAESASGVTMRHDKIAASFQYKIHDISDAEFEQAYAEIISEVLKFSLAARDMSEFFTPVAVIRIFSEILRKYNVSSVYNPFAGTAAFCADLDENVSYIGDEISQRVYAYALLRLESLHRKNAEVLRRDSFRTLMHVKDQYDAIIANMPWGNTPDRMFRTYEDYFLTEAANYAKSLSIGLYPYNILVGAYARRIRESLLRDDYLQAVIRFPKSIFDPQRKLQSCIIITNKHKQHAGFVQFIDASQCMDSEGAFSVEAVMSVLDRFSETEFSKWVPTKELLRGEYYWLMEPYMQSPIQAPKGFHTERLGNIIKPIRRVEIPAVENLPMIRISDLSDKPFEEALNHVEVASTTIPSNHRNLYLNQDAILIATIGNKLKATYYTHSSEGAMLHSNVTAYEVVSKDLLPKYIVRELWQPYVIDQLVYIGSAIGRLSLPLFDEVEILVPDNDSDFKIQESLIEETYQEQLSDKERELQATHEEYKEEINTRKHAIQNTMSGPLVDLLSFKMSMEENGGHISFDDNVGSVNPMSAKQMLESILNRLQVVETQITHLDLFNDNYGESVDVDLNEYIQHFITAFPSGRYKYSYRPSGHNVPKVIISKRALDAIFNNIISNAQSHGFVNPDRKDYEIDFNLYLDEDCVVLEIANNGAPLEIGYSAESVFEYYISSKFGRDGHSGRGGYDVRRILKKYGATVKFVSTPDKTFTAMYSIRFTNIKIEDNNDTAED